jgi:hypothetical protein
VLACVAGGQVCNRQTHQCGAVEWHDTLARDFDGLDPRRPSCVGEFREPTCDHVQHIAYESDTCVGNTLVEEEAPTQCSSEGTRTSRDYHCPTYCGREDAQCVVDSGSTNLQQTNIGASCPSGESAARCECWDRSVVDHDGGTAAGRASCVARHDLASCAGYAFVVKDFCDGRFLYEARLSSTLAGAQAPQACAPEWMTDAQGARTGQWLPARDVIDCQVFCNNATATCVEQPATADATSQFYCPAAVGEPVGRCVCN